MGQYFRNNKLKKNNYIDLSVRKNKGFLSVSFSLSSILIFLIFIVSIFILNTGCTYRFTNLHTNLHGIKSVFVENVFNTSSTILPYEILWISVQETIAKDGHLKLVSSEEADAIVKIQLNYMALSPTGSVITTGNYDDDPKKAASKENDISYEKFVRLAQSASYTQNDVLIVEANVQIINLYTKNVLFAKTYRYSETLSSIYNYHYPVYKEALSHDFKKISDKIAYNVLHDFIYN